MPDFAPGARVLVRDEEWVVRDVMPCDQGGYQLECMGWSLSETVLNREGIFLSLLDKVTVLDPAQTELVADETPEFLASRLYLEASLRQTVPTGARSSPGPPTVQWIHLSLPARSGAARAPATAAALLNC